MTLYIDIIFLENLFMNCIILFATALILKSEIKVLKILLSSTIGSIYAIITYLAFLKIFSNVFLKIILSLAMIYLAFSPRNIKSFLKALLIFYLTSFTFGGITFALIYFINPNKVLFNNGFLVGIYPLKIILTGGFLGFIIIIISFRTIKTKLTKNDMICTLTIIMNNKLVNINAIIDTGNFLVEPITKTPVIVIEKNVLKNVVPDKMLNNIENITKGMDVDLEEYISKIRLIPFSSLGKENRYDYRNNSR